MVSPKASKTVRASEADARRPRMSWKILPNDFESHVRIASEISDRLNIVI